MSQRPELSWALDGTAFRSFYYLKRELADFCRENGLPTSGSKAELTDRIAYFLDTGSVLKPTAERKTAVNSGTLTEDTVIEPNIVCSEKHRAFFSEKIGNSFSFNVPFQKWLKANAGKTYGDAIRAYYRILEEKKQVKAEIGRQFEYNTYIRDFFADNPGKSLHDAIVCWNYKKGLPGHHRYEQSDLCVLDLQILQNS
ncbi:MAG: DUF6434 domain-containing protein [Oscillospiraceae bacterium]